MAENTNQTGDWMYGSLLCVNGPGPCNGGQIKFIVSNMVSDHDKINLFDVNIPVLSHH